MGSEMCIRDSIGIPCDAEGWEDIQPIYESMPGWEQSTEGKKAVADLPDNALNYIRRLEELVGVPVDIISTGPDRVETIMLRHPFA